MKISGLRVCALFAGCIVIAACSQPTNSRFQFTPTVNSAVDRGAGPLNYRVLHSFGAGYDGEYLIAGLISAGDTFYGTTSTGGTRGFGTVFSITTGGTERVLHSFGKGRNGDGSTPYGGLIDVNGTLYGTTYGGGVFGDGTVFSITPDGKEKVLHSFGKGTDGQYPVAGLTDVGGTLYGTTENGGTNECGFRFNRYTCGTVFRITTDGKEKVLHSFGKGTDGWFPAAGLTNVDGSLYGTTVQGGGHYLGTVFSITTGGKEKVLYSFRGEPDGLGPAYASLIEVKGTLYGTTIQGGAHNNGGTVYSVTRDGSERVLHSFGEGTDGNFPAGSLIDERGTLYGTTVGGGTNDCGHGANGCGTVYTITRAGKEKVLHNFGSGTGGNGPVAGLAYEGGSLFGTTQAGGAFSGGTVFSLRP